MNILLVKSLERLTLHRSYKNFLMPQGNHPLGSKPNNRETAHLQAIEFKRLSQAHATLAKTSPQNRLIQLEEAAALAVFLAQDGCKGITGKGINVDGGGVMS